MLFEKLKELFDKFQIQIYAMVAALMVVLLAVLLADILYQPKKMLKRGYEIDISANGQLAKKEVKQIDIATLMKTANVDNGAKIFKKCATCHTIEKGGANKVGPNLANVVGRKRAAIAGFSYSEAMVKKGGSWSREDLNQFLTKPKNFVPGTKMGFAGLSKPQDRADVISYLEKQ